MKKLYICTPYGVAFLSQKYIILNVGRYWIKIFLIKALLLPVRMGFLILSVVPISLQFSFRGYIVRIDFYDAISKREIQHKEDKEESLHIFEHFVK